MLLKVFPFSCLPCWVFVHSWLPFRLLPVLFWSLGHPPLLYYLSLPSAFFVRSLQPHRLSTELPLIFAFPIEFSSGLLFVISLVFLCSQVFTSPLCRLCSTPFEIRGSLPSSFRVAHWKMILTPHWHLWILQKWAFLLVRKFYLWVTHPLTFKQKNEEKKSLMHTVCIFATVSSLLYSCLAFPFPSSLFSSGFLLIILLMSAHSSSGRLSLALPAESLVCCFD